MGGMHGQYAWPVRMAGTHGWYAWPVYLAGTYGRYAWPVHMAGTHGRYAWPVRMAPRAGRYAWPANLRASQYLLGTDQLLARQYLATATLNQHPLKPRNTVTFQAPFACSVCLLTE
eukprot:239550-Chlamydomonas_euryale.AAC.1